MMDKDNDILTHF